MVGIRTAAGVLAAVFALGLFAIPAQAEEDEDFKKRVESIVKDMRKDEDYRAYWANTSRMKTKDKKVDIKFGGRIMIDFAWYGADEVEEHLEDEGIDPDPDDWAHGSGAEFRRVWLESSGTLYNHVGFSVSLGFENQNTVEFKDVWISLRNLEDCFGCAFPEIKVGHFKQYMCLDELTSSKYITFMERSAIAQAFAPSFRTGVGISKTDLRGGSFGYMASLYSPDSGQPNASSDIEDDEWYWSDGVGVSARLFWAPWFDCDCKCRRLHLGISAAYEMDLGSYRARSRPPTHLTTRFVNTGSFAADEVLKLGAEIALVYGPWSFQAEAIAAQVESEEADDPMYWGWYAYVTYWLTGECRNYKGGTFGRVKPCCNFLDNDCCCTGGWELKARVEQLDLSDGPGVGAAGDGGIMSSVTVGVNWHLNPNSRFMFEYFVSTFDDFAYGYFDGYDSPTSEWDNTMFHGFQMRFQVDF